jgi:hypothetical protein
MAELADFLATVNVFAALDASERAEAASRCRVHRELIAAGRRAGDVQMPAIAEASERLKPSRRPRSNIVGRMSEPHSFTS